MNALRSFLLCAWALGSLSVAARLAVAQGLPESTGDSISVKLQGVELGFAVQMLGRYLDRPVLLTGPASVLVTLESPRPVSRAEILPLLRGLLDAHGFELVEDSLSRTLRARPRSGQPPQSQMIPPRNAQRAGGEVGVHVIALKHARASDVANTIATVYGRNAAPDDAAPSGSSTLADELRGNLVNPVAGRQSGSPPQTTSRTASITGDLTIVADARANALLLRANRADLETVRALVEQIDVRPLQVLIEVLIAEVRRDRSLGIGVEAAASSVSVPGTGISLDGVLESEGLGDFALRVMGIGGVDAEATLQLAAQRGEVRILSRPVVLAANNQQAQIVVGSQRPFVQVQRALPTDGASRDQVVQYKDVGTKLTVIPSISEDGSVHLDVTQEVSNATTETAFNAPIISTRSVQTQLLVRDGQTVTLGGLTDRQVDRSSRGIPLLSSIPLIGGLFGSSVRRTTETELFVFITPRVIRTDDDAMRLSNPIRERALGEKP